MFPKLARVGTTRQAHRQLRHARPSRATGWTLALLSVAALLSIMLAGYVNLEKARDQQIAALHRAMPVLAADAVTRIGRMTTVVSTLLDLADLRAQFVSRSDQGAADGVTRQIQNLLDSGVLGLRQITWISARDGTESTMSAGPAMPLWGQTWQVPKEADATRLMIRRYPGFGGQMIQIARTYRTSSGSRAGVAVTLVATNWVTALIQGTAAPAGARVALFDLASGNQMTPGASLIAGTVLRAALARDHPVILTDASTAMGPAMLVAQQLAGTPMAVVVAMPYQVIAANARVAAIAAVRRVAGIAIPLAILAAGILTLLRWRATAAARITLAASRETAESEARQRMERLIRDMSTALFAGAAGRRGGFTLDYVSGNIDRFCARKVIRLGLGRLGSCIAVDHLALREFVRQVVAEGEAAATLQGQAPDGKPIWLRLRGWRGSPQRDGRRHEIYGQIADISREQEMQAAMLTSSKFATLGELAAGLAHEVMQPVTAMSFAAENILIALNSADPAQIQKAGPRLNLIIEQAQRVRGIVEHLRIFTRNESAGTGPVSLAQAFSGAMLLMGMALRQASVEVAADIAEDLPMVSAQLVPLEQVFVNLLSNARDALAEQEGPRRVRVSAWARSDSVLVHVTDNGPGIPPAVREHIFEPFFTTKSANTGTGLGLWLCAGTLARFGGQIRAISPEGGGAVFELTLSRYVGASAAMAALTTT